MVTRLAGLTDMAAATTDVPAVALADIEKALTLSVSQALCTAATAQPFLPDACAQAAKAHKHDAFASRLQQHVRSLEVVRTALLTADQRVCSRLASSPAAEQFIDAAGVDVQPTFVPPATPGGKGKISTTHQAVRSRQAGNMAKLWTLRHAMNHFGHATAVAVQKQSGSYQDIAGVLDNALRQSLPRVAADIFAALNELEREDAAAQPPPAKRHKSGSLIFNG